MRIRGSLFFRDETRAMDSVFRRLNELGITPNLNRTFSSEPLEDLVIEDMKRRAQELRSAWRSGVEENVT